MTTSRTALIIGASYGIGRAVAIGLAREGFDIAIVARGTDGLQETKKAIDSTHQKCLIVSADISKQKDIDKVFNKVSAQFNSIDFLWNGASPFSEEGLENIEDTFIRDFADTTYYGTLMLTKKFIPLLKAGKGAHIINVASDWALPGTDGPAPFSAAKFALVGFTQGLNNEFSKHGVYASVLYLSEVGSQYSIDDTVELVQKEAGNVIVLADVVKTVIFMTSLETASVPSIVLLGK